MAMEISFGLLREVCQSPQTSSRHTKGPQRSPDATQATARAPQGLSRTPNAWLKGFLNPPRLRRPHYGVPPDPKGYRDPPQGPKSSPRRHNALPCDCHAMLYHVKPCYNPLLCYGRVMLARMRLILLTGMLSTRYYACMCYAMVCYAIHFSREPGPIRNTFC